MQESRNIPLPIQRAVRQRCGFGCVICGMPLYEYDHMKEWAIVKEHVAEDLTLLCDFHHKQVTNKLISREQVAKFNLNPFNLQNGRSKEMPLHFAGDTCKVIIGNNSFKITKTEDTSYLYPIVIDGIPLIGFIIQDEHLLLNINQFDEFNNPLLRIVNNQLAYSTSPWDIELTGNKLTIREKPKSFILVIRFLPPNKIEIEKGLFYCNGLKISIKKDKVVVEGKESMIEYSDTHTVNCNSGLIIGQRSKASGLLFVENIKRY